MVDLVPLVNNIEENKMNKSALNEELESDVIGINEQFPEEKKVTFLKRVLGSLTVDQIIMVMCTKFGLTEYINTDHLSFDDKVDLILKVHTKTPVFRKVIFDKLFTRELYSIKYDIPTEFQLALLDKDPEFAKTLFTSIETISDVVLEKALVLNPRFVFSTKLDTEYLQMLALDTNIIEAIHWIPRNDLSEKVWKRIIKADPFVLLETPNNPADDWFPSYEGVEQDFLDAILNHKPIDKLDDLKKVQEK